MQTCKSVERALRADMLLLNNDELVNFAQEMGIDAQGLDRQEIENTCIEMELYAFTH